MTVTVPFPAAIAVSDVYILVPWNPANAASDQAQLTTDGTEVRSDIAIGTGAELSCIELGFDFSSQNNARRQSYWYGLIDDHVYRDNTK